MMDLELQLIEEPSEDVRVGSKFQSFNDFMVWVKQREKLMGERWVKDTGGRTIEMANQAIKDTRRHYKSCWRYQYVNYRCIHGGTFKPRGLAKRKSSSMKMGCPAHIQLAAKRKEDALVVSKFHTVHNHDLNPSDFGHYAVDRKPTKEEQEEVMNLKRLGVANSRIRNYMVHNFGKLFTREDVNNMSKRPLLEASHITNQCVRIPANLLKENSASCLPENSLDNTYFPPGDGDAQGLKMSTAAQRAQRLEVASKLTEDLMDVMVSCAQYTFERRCTILRTLLDIWRPDPRDRFSRSNSLKLAGRNLQKNFTSAGGGKQNVQVISHNQEPVNQNLHTMNQTVHPGGQTLHTVSQTFHVVDGNLQAVEPNFQTVNGTILNAGQTFQTKDGQTVTVDSIVNATDQSFHTKMENFDTDAEDSFSAMEEDLHTMEPAKIEVSIGSEKTAELSQSSTGIAGGNLVGHLDVATGSIIIDNNQLGDFEVETVVLLDDSSSDTQTLQTSHGPGTGISIPESVCLDLLNGKCTLEVVTEEGRTEVPPEKLEEYITILGGENQVMSGPPTGGENQVISGPPTGGESHSITVVPAAGVDNQQTTGDNSITPPDPTAIPETENNTQSQSTDIQSGNEQVEVKKEVEEKEEDNDDDDDNDEVEYVLMMEGDEFPEGMEDAEIVVCSGYIEGDGDAIMIKEEDLRDSVEDEDGYNKEVVDSEGNVIGKLAFHEV